jgi:hypothetical protein
MTHRVFLAFSILLPAAALVLSLPAQAAGTLTRTFVSSGGSDANTCAITQPCASFAVAYAAVAANGIVAALDPGKYGPLTITYPVTINGNGWAAVTAPAQGNGFTINAGTGNVALIGLEIDGAQAAYNGIVFNSGSSLTVIDCTVQNFVLNNSNAVFSGNGMMVSPTTSGAVSLTVLNTTLSNNKNNGLDYYAFTGAPNLNAVIDRVTATGNQNGITLNMTVSGGSASAIVTESIASNNSAFGIYVANGGGAAMVVSIDSTTVANNLSQGIAGNNTAQVTLARSIVIGNNVGIQNSTSPNTFYSYGDNLINLNSSHDFFGTSLNTFTDR